MNDMVLKLKIVLAGFTTKKSIRKLLIYFFYNLRIGQKFLTFSIPGDSLWQKYFINLHIWIFFDHSMLFFKCLHQWRKGNASDEIILDSAKENKF